MFFMKRFVLFLLLVLSTAAGLSAAPKAYTLKSPDGRLEMRISTVDGIRYDVLHEGMLLLERSQASMTLGDGTIYGGTAMKVRRARTRSVDEVAEAVAYKKSEVRENFNELELDCGGYKVIFRAYDDACAYRFISLSRTPFTVTDFEEFLKELESIKKSGFATDMEENEEGVRCVAAAIPDIYGEYKYALSVSAPASRMSEEKLKETARLVLEAASNISK